MTSTETVPSDDSKGELSQAKATDIASSDIKLENTLNSDNVENSSENTSDGVQVERPKYFNGVEISQLTKRQMKKYLKTLKWEARKKEKRANERQKAKKRKMEAKLNNLDLGPSRKQLKRSTMANSPCKIGIVIDLSFDHLMIDKVIF